MGMWTTAYLVYGTPLPASADLGQVERAIDGNTNGVGYLSAGSYDNDTIYLTTYCESADLGKPKTLHLPEDVHPDWDRILRHAAELLGLDYAALDEPSWLLVADVS